MKKITQLLLVLIPFIGFSQNNVTFQVDLTQYTGTYTQVNLNGDFNAWCGTCAPMTDANNDGIYDLTVLVPNDSMEFKFTLDGWTVDEQFTGGEPCTKTTGAFTNRFAKTTKDTTLPVFCWESCTSCSGTPVSRNVTFQVDLSTYTGSYTEVNLNGDFNNWCGSCAAMTDANNDSIYELTVNVSTDTIEYKFTLDGWTVDEQFAGGEPCTITVTDPTGTFVNRMLAPSGDTTIPAVCWQSCAACSAIGLEENSWVDVQFSPNPTTGIVNITGEYAAQGSYTLNVTDLTGKQIFTADLNGTSINQLLDLSGLVNGIYLVHIKGEQGVYTEKVLLRN